MNKLTLKIALTVAVALLLAANLSVMAMEPTPEEETTDLAEAVDCSEIEGEEDAMVALFGAEAKPIKPGPNCLSGQALSCASMPIPVGGTCSCTSTLLGSKCRVCESGNKGRVLQTTCTVHVPCTGFPCDINQNFTRTAISCAG